MNGNMKNYKKLYEEEVKDTKWWMDRAWEQLKLNDRLLETQFELSTQLDRKNLDILLLLISLGIVITLLIIK